MFPRLVFILLGLLVFAIVGIGVWSYTGGLFGMWRHQMATGAAYMKSLKDSDLPPWIERTNRLLAEWTRSLGPIGAYGVGGKPIPPDLQQLGIIRIDILQDQVRYVWMGGMDHTELEIDRLADGTFRFVAHYDDAHSEVIWHKGPNQTMQPTAGRFDASLCFMKTLHFGPHSPSPAAADLYLVR